MATSEKLDRITLTTGQFAKVFVVNAELVGASEVDVRMWVRTVDLRKVGGIDGIQEFTRLGVDSLVREREGGKAGIYPHSRACLLRKLRNSVLNEIRAIELLD